MDHRQIAAGRAERRPTGRLQHGSIVLLRWSLGLVFLIFGALKLIPGLSPAEELVRPTVSALTLGLVPGDVGLLLVALLETAIGVSLLTGRWLRLGLALLGLATIGILSPLVLLPEQLFAAQAAMPVATPTLVGQYVLKDIVLVAAALVVAVETLRQPVAAHAPAAAPARAAAASRHWSEDLAA